MNRFKIIHENKFSVGFENEKDIYKDNKKTHSIIERIYLYSDGNITFEKFEVYIDGEFEVVNLIVNQVMFRWVEKEMKKRGWWK